MKKVFVLLSTLLMVGMLFGCNSTAKQSSESKPIKVEGNDSASKATVNYSFSNGVATLEDIKIEITKEKVIPVGKKGNEYGEKPVLAFWYKVTNITGKEIDPSTAWIAVFEAFQDTDANQVNQLDVGTLPDDKYLDSQSENIKKGKTAESAISYELDDLKTPVILKAFRGIGGEKLGEQTFEIK